MEEFLMIIHIDFDCRSKKEFFLDHDMIGSSIPSGKVVVWEIQLQQNYDNFYGWMKQYSHESLVFAEKNLLASPRKIIICYK